MTDSDCWAKLARREKKAREAQMTIAIESTIHAVETIVQAVPVGTNLGLSRLLWALMNGSFLGSRGAIFPALAASGFSAEESRQSWSALRYGAWAADDLLEPLQQYAQLKDGWSAHRYEGYEPVAVDWSTFWRPKLVGWPGKYYHGFSRRAEKGVGLGLIGKVGQIGEQRIALLQKIVRADQDEEMSAKGLKAETLGQAARLLAPQEVVVVDAGVRVVELQEASIDRYVVRQAINCIGRRNYLPDPNATGRPREYGEIVRPLARTRDGHEIPASAPDQVDAFQYDGRTIRVHSWHQLVRTEQKVAVDNETFSIWVFFDPLFTTPLVVATPLALQPRSIFCFYLDRWPIEQPPLVTKQLLGLQRQFVFAEENCWRLPELALIAGNLLTVQAALLPPMPTGFWDRFPKRTPGRLRRVLARAPFPEVMLRSERLRKKAALTAHLPTGSQAHLRKKAAI